MKESKQLSANKSKGKEQSQNKKHAQQMGNSIDTCTRDPCPMITKSKSGKYSKCPKCGMEN